MDLCGFVFSCQIELGQGVASACRMCEGMHGIGILFIMILSSVAYLQQQCWHATSWCYLNREHSKRYTGAKESWAGRCDVVAFFHGDLCPKAAGVLQVFAVHVFVSMTSLLRVWRQFPGPFSTRRGRRLRVGFDSPSVPLPGEEVALQVSLWFNYDSCSPSDWLQNVWLECSGGMVHELLEGRF